MKKLLRFFVVFVVVAVTSFIFSSFSKNSDNDIAAKSSIFSTKDSSFSIALIGDSLAKGTGDETAEGILTYLSENLKSKTDKKISVYNGGVDNLRSDELLAQLQTGNFPSPLSSFDLIVISIGGNDILSLQHVEDANKYEAFIEKQDNYLENLRVSLNKIREINPNAFVAVIGLYNPRDDAFSQLNSMILGVWNRGTQKVVEENNNAVYVPTNDIFKTNLDSLISSDSLHPNSAGYKAVTERLITSVENR